MTIDEYDVFVGCNDLIVLNCYIVQNLYSYTKYQFMQLSYKILDLCPARYGR